MVGKGRLKKERKFVVTDVLLKLTNPFISKELKLSKHISASKLRESLINSISKLSL